MPGLLRDDHETTVPLSARWLLELADSLDGTATNRSPVLPEYEGLPNFRRFASEQLRVVDRRSGSLVPLDLNWIQRQILAAELLVTRAGRRPWFLILKYRRGGVTTLQQALCYHTAWSRQHAFVGTLAHRSDDTRSIFRMVDRFYDGQPESARHQRTSASVHTIEFPEWGSVYKAETAGAQGAFRGSRLDRVHLSEAASYPELGAVHRAVADAVESRPYVIESTARGRDGRGEAFYEFWQIAKRGESAFVPLFFAWHHDPANQLALAAPDELGALSDEESRLQSQFDLSLEQVKWWREKRRELVADGRSSSAISQEHPSDDESAFLVSGEGYYSAELIDRAHGMVRSPIPLSGLQQNYPKWMRNDVERGRLRIWEEPQPGSRYVLGVDPAGGVGRDDSAIIAVDADSGEQAFAWHWNEISPDELGARVLGDREEGLGWRWRGSELGDPAYIVVERENHGHAVLTALLRIAHYPSNLVHHDVDVIREGAEPSKRAGWRHNHVQITNAIGRMLREQFPILRDRETVASIRRVSEENGSAKLGGRDLAVAAGLCAIGLEHAKPPGGFAYIGGRIVDLESGRPSPEGHTGSIW